MKRSEILNRRLTRLIAKRDKLSARALASTDVNEVRSINEQLEDINAEIFDTQSEYDAALAVEKAEEESEQRQAVPPASATLVNGGMTAAGSVVATFDSNTRSTENPYESMEYRRAFMAYVQRGAAIPADLLTKIEEYRMSLPAEMRAGVPVTTADTGAVTARICRRI